jgi:hypothetical protein
MRYWPANFPFSPQGEGFQFCKHEACFLRRLRTWAVVNLVLFGQNAAQPRFLCARQPIAKGIAQRFHGCHMVVAINARGGAGGQGIGIGNRGVDDL